MSKKDLLRLMRLLFALESLASSTGRLLPDYLLDDLNVMVKSLEDEILKDTND